MEKPFLFSYYWTSDHKYYKLVYAADEKAAEKKLRDNLEDGELVGVILETIL